MKKTFQKTLLAAAAGVALMGAASANSLLFPYWTTANGAQSVLSIYGNNNIIGNASGFESLHYVYNYGPACTHFDGFGRITRNDMLQHSVASTAAGGFGMAVATDTSRPFYFPSKDANSYGFLVVSTRTTAGATELISGEMVVADPSTGLMASYAGISNHLDTTIAGNEGNFAAITDQRFNLGFFSPAVAATSWYGVVVGDMSAKIAAGADWDGNNVTTNNGVIYDNEERPYSGTVTKRIQCAGSFTQHDLMNSAQKDAIAGSGGLIHATSLPWATDAGGNPVSPSTGLVLMKMQLVQSAVGKPFAGFNFLHREMAPAW